jgi:hypothetical protein
VNVPACTTGLLSKHPQPGMKSGIATSGTDIKVNLYPNPSTTNFTLQVVTASKEEISVRVLDMTGRFYKQLTVMPYQTINVGAELKTGSYLIEVKQGGVMKTVRVMKL